MKQRSSSQIKSDGNASPARAPERLASALQPCDHTVERIDLYRFDVNKPRHFSSGTWHSRSHLAIRLWSGCDYGWGEYIAARNGEPLDLTQHARPYHALLGQSLGDSLEVVRKARGRWPGAMTEAMEMALIDVAGRRLGQSALELLGLEGRAPVPGLYCILDDHPDRVREEATQALRFGLWSHIKCKLFANPDIDQAAIEAVRSVMPANAYVIGDVNAGYASAPIETLTATLRRLHTVGLNAVEDPASLSPSDWQTLQQHVGSLDLVVDEPLRGAADATDSFTPNMGGIYNIHPGATRSILDAVELAWRIEESGSTLMVGDDSLIGPACTAWIQMAIGLGAAWVEAIEKSQENSQFTLCQNQCGTAQRDGGKFTLLDERPGFGLTVNERSLHQSALDHVTLHH